MAGPRVSLQHRKFVDKQIRAYLLKNKVILERGEVAVRGIADRFGVSTLKVRALANQLNVQVHKRDNLSLENDPRFKLNKEQIRSWGFTGLICRHTVHNKEN